jgi:hypothetical protein
MQVEKRLVTYLKSDVSPAEAVSEPAALETKSGHVCATPRTLTTRIGLTLLINIRRDGFKKRPVGFCNFDWIGVVGCDWAR